MSTPTGAADFIKDPDAVLDYIFDWSDWLPNGDTIISSEFVISPGLTIGPGPNGGPDQYFTTTNATVWLSGGSQGQPYAVTNQVTTAGGRTDDRTITIRVQQR